MNDAGTSTKNANPYLALGVRPFINCCSVRTMHGGSLMLPQVRAAVAEASRYFVNLDELMEAAGQRLAELTGAEWGMVTCGSAAAVALGTAGVVAGNDPVRMLRLPFTDGWVNRVIMVKNQRFAYDQAIRMVGTRIVEVESVAELDAALAEPVAMMAALGTHEAEFKVRFEDLVARAKPRNIPILVDAASEHLQRPSPWLVRGADLVVYSGGKFLRGPQTSGLLLGKKNLVQAAWRNASPHQALGRPMKVSKEDVIGLLAAVEYWIENREVAQEQARWRGDIQEVADIVTGLAGVRGEVIEPSGVVQVPVLRIKWDTATFPIDGLTLRQRLLDGTPRVMLDDNTALADSISIDPFGLQQGEATELGHAIARELRASKGKKQSAAAAQVADLSGEWDVRVRFLQGERSHRLRLSQTGGRLAGEQQSQDYQGAVDGAVAGNGVEMNFRARYEGSTISYHFEGEVADGRMQGVVALGSATDHHGGLVNLSQFGTGKWEAVRVA